MRIPGTIRALLAALVLVALIPAASQAAGGATAEDLVAKAQSGYDMQCATFGDAWSCGSWPLAVRFQPVSGTVTFLHATSDESADDGMSDTGRRMLTDFSTAICLDPVGVATFVGTVAALTGEGTVGPTTLAQCRLAGGWVFSNCEFGCYWVDVAAIEPVSTPTPQPSRTPRPTPVVKPTPTPVPTQLAASPTPSPSPSPSASLAASPSPSDSPTAIASSTATATPTAEQSVLAGHPSSSSSAAPAGAVADGDPTLPGALAASVAVPSEVSVDPAAIAGSALLALLLLLFMGFASELFNSTVESNYDEIRGWFHLGSRRWFRGALWSTPVGVGLFVALAALVYLLLDPAVALNLESVAVYLGMVAGLGIVLLAFEAPGLLMYRRRTGQSAGVRALPWTLPAAIVCVAISRTLGLEPAYLYGLLLGLVFQQQLTSGQEGVQTAVGAAWTLVVALAAWVGLGLVEPNGVPAAGIAGLLASTALAVVVVGGLEAVAFGLLPLRFLAGDALYRWRRMLWALLFGLSAFFFIHVLVGPHTGYLSQLSPEALVAAFGAFAVFGAFSVLFWAYFRFRPARVAARS